ncbi:hypothetical protein [Candidatus Promineifilum breve]|uniref:hypothetical protein n=1 Tax=Candidatus Promineifilum breve TaxID=1806508 RepID=UPI0012FF85CE|nr:hypothetical protein [Candidatus Promineifilum breve]
MSEHWPLALTATWPLTTVIVASGASGWAHVAPPLRASSSAAPVTVTASLRRSRRRMPRDNPLNRW